MTTVSKICLLGVLTCCIACLKSEPDLLAAPDASEGSIDLGPLISQTHYVAVLRDLASIVEMQPADLGAANPTYNVAIGLSHQDYRWHEPGQASPISMTLTLLDPALVSEWQASLRGQALPDEWSLQIAIAEGEIGVVDSMFPMSHVYQRGVADPAQYMSIVAASPADSIAQLDRVSDYAQTTPDDDVVETAD